MARLTGILPGPWARKNTYLANMGGKEWLKMPFDWTVYEREEEEALAPLWARSEALPQGELVGYMAAFGVADGLAVYYVEKVSPLQLRWVPISDGYSLPAAHIRGLKVADLLRMQIFERMLARAAEKGEAEIKEASNA